MNRLLPLTLAILCVVGLEFTHAQIPSIISYQGLVEGTDGPVDLTFRLYATEVGGVLLWSETHDGVTLNSEGVFGLTLGSSESLSDLGFDIAYWLEVAVDGDVTSPRTRLTVSPYSRRANVADNLAEGALTPEGVGSSNSPQNSQVLSYDASSNSFKWQTIAVEGGSINELIEGDGIKIDGLTGPSSTISIAALGIQEGMFAPNSVSSRAIADGGISTADIANKALTQEKFADGVGLPNVGTAGGVLKGNYPNPGLADTVVSELTIKSGAVSSRTIEDGAVTSDEIASGAVNEDHVNVASDLEIASLVVTGTVTSEDHAIDGTLEVTDNSGIGATASAGQTRLLVMAQSAAQGARAIDAQDANGNSILTVRADGNVGINTNSPAAGLEVAKANADAIVVSSGGVVFSTAVVTAGAAVAIPANTSVVEVTGDGLPGSANAVTLPAGSPGEILIIANQDDDPLIFPLAVTINTGQARMFVFLPLVGRWQVLN